MDTPETTHPTRGVEPHGPEAAAYTTARLTGATVRLRALIPAGADIDAYGRLLRTSCSPADEHVTRALIRAGYATAILAVSLRNAEYLGEAQARHVAAKGNGPMRTGAAEAKGDTTS